MKRTFMKFLPIAAAILLATSCSKDGDNNVVTNPVDNPTPAQEQEATPTHSTLTMTFKVSASAGLSKIGIADDNGKSGVAPKFEAGDRIHFADDDNKVTADVTLTENDLDYDHTTAEFVVEFDGTDEGLASFKNGEISLTATMGTPLMKISGEYSTLEAAIRAHSYQVSGPIDYSETQTDIYFTEQTSYLEISSPQSTVDINGVTYTLTDGKVYVAAPAETDITSLALGLCNTTKQGTIHTITRHYLPKEFTVNAEGKTVEFSCGNLQYKPITFEWRFAPHQWDKCHATGDKVGEYYKSWTDSKWTDLFGWGMWLSRESPTQTATDNSKYLPNVTSGEFSGASDISSYWTTLTTAEWQYLFNSRGDGKYGQGSVDGVNGIIILPDDWTYPTDMSVSAPSSFTSGASAWTNAYTEVDWQKMEAAGAVFLPAAGCRNGTGVYGVGVYGNYWSSSALHKDNAWDLNFDSGDVDPLSDDGRYYGQSVRLVRSL